MATVSIAPSPHAIGTMASGRLPLSNLPNAANSPCRAVAAPMKRSRSQSVTAPDVSCVQPPPFKKKVVEAEESALSTPKKRSGLAVLETIISRNERAGAARASKQQRPDENVDNLRQWQKHYRKAFPGFVFYFENVPDDARRLCARGIQSLGARQEKFFSKDVTHVVTTRNVPIENELSPTEPSTHSSLNAESLQTRTINPSLLERRTEDTMVAPRTKFPSEQSTTRRSQLLGPDIDGKRQALVKGDILLKAKEMGMKIWQVEKLQRIMNVILDEQMAFGDASLRNNTQRTTGSRSSRRPDLSQMIRNEQMNGPTEREVSVTTFDIIPFKGPHIYVRDMAEKTKPILVREYPRVANREDGEWPQFRSVSAGKCPFVEEDTHARRLAEKALAREQVRVQKAAELGAPRTRSTAAKTHMEPPPYAGRKRPLAEIENNANTSAQMPQKLPENNHIEPTLTKPLPNGSQSVEQNGLGGEPMASGLQGSNITSAIRSQMISSTAAGPGARAGTSKEIHGLQRKVLERNSGPGVSSLMPSRRMADIAGAARGTQRAAKQRAQERMGLAQIHEDEQSTEGIDNKPAALRLDAAKGAKKEKKDMKPGYCENCKEKFEDFNEHTAGKRHRKFATTKENWRELDELLSLLGRPLRDE